MTGESAPPGWSGSVTAMRKHHKDIENPYAIAWYEKKKGDHPHYKKTPDDKSTGDKVPEKKDKYKKEHTVQRKTFAEWLQERVALEHKLTANDRKHIKKSNFAEPDKSAYPIEDKNHAKSALSRVSQFGSPEEKEKVRAAVHRKYPSIGSDN